MLFAVSPFVTVCDTCSGKLANAPLAKVSVMTSPACCVLPIVASRLPDTPPEITVALATAPGWLTVITPLPPLEAVMFAALNAVSLLIAVMSCVAMVAAVSPFATR